MEELKKISNLVIIIGLIAFVAVLSYYFFKLKATPNPIEYSNIFTCGKQNVPFRVNISSCNAVPISPDEKTLTNALTSPFIKNIVMLVDPNETGGTAVSAFEIYKIYESFYLQNVTGIRPGVAYTTFWEKQPNIPNITIEEANFQNPIIWLRKNQTKTEIIADGSKIYINAASQQDLDAASCKISILVIKKILDC